MLDQDWLPAVAGMTTIKNGSRVAAMKTSTLEQRFLFPWLTAQILVRRDHLSAEKEKRGR